ncbi:hypothetical protein VJJ19_07485 [Parvimonas sp. D4]|nr:hypothetical protein [Parvimonas sp. D4]
MTPALKRFSFHEGRCRVVKVEAAVLLEQAEEVAEPEAAAAADSPHGVQTARV